MSTDLDIRDRLIINPELTVHLHRYPAGEWVLMDSVTRLSPAGVALAESAMSDSSGPVGRAAQSLLIARR